MSSFANPVSMREPVYAMVNKPRRNRRTVHVDENIANSLHIEDPPQDVYAVVNKPGRPQASQNGPSTSSAASYLNQGARPKIKSSTGLPTMSTTSSTRSYTRTYNVNMTAMDFEDDTELDVGYDTIGDIQNNNTQHCGGASPVDVDDPDYAGIVDTAIDTAKPPSDYDPNYETVPNMVGRMGEFAPNNNNATSSASGLVHIDAAASSVGGQQRWKKREHIYEDISETRQKSRAAQNNPIVTDL